MELSDDGPFGAECMKDIAGIARIIEKPEKTQQLRAVLIPIAIKYQEIIASTPTDLPSSPYNITLTKRIEWIESNVVRAARRLVAALDAPNVPMLSTWPDGVSGQSLPDIQNLTSDLSSLRAFAENLVHDLRRQQKDKANHSQEIRADIFVNIAAAVHVVLPEIPPSRGTYDKISKQRNGVYPDLIRRIFKEITGLTELLDRLIEGEVKTPSR